VSLCKTRLPTGFERYSDNMCGQSFAQAPMCSVQHAWLAAEPHASPASVLQTYDLVLVLEDFDTSLAVLHFDYGVPLRALPYLVANQDKSAPMPHITHDVKTRVLNHGLALDHALHRLAHATLTRRAQALNASTDGYFQVVLNRLAKARALAQQECSSDDAYKKDDCIVTSRLVLKQESCRHACLDLIWDKVL